MDDSLKSYWEYQNIESDVKRSKWLSDRISYIIYLFEKQYVPM
jgi:hypothetical protein